MVEDSNLLKNLHTRGTYESTIQGPNQATSCSEEVEATSNIPATFFSMVRVYEEKRFLQVQYPHTYSLFFVFFCSELVEKCFSEYSVSTMERKKEIVAGILAKLEKNGGGFRQYDPKTQQYLCLNDEMSRQKVMHAIQHRIRLIKKKETTESVKESTVANVKTTQSANACREKVHQPPSPLAAAQQFVSPPPLFPQQPKLASVLTVPPHYKSAVNVPARFGSEASSHVHNNDQPGCLYERIGDSLLQAFLDPTWQPMYSSMALKDDTFGEDLVEDIARRALEDVRKLRSRRNNNRRRPSLGVGKPETIR